MLIIDTAAISSESGVAGFNSIAARRFAAGEISSSVNPCWIRCHALAVIGLPLVQHLVSEPQLQAHSRPASASE